MKTATAYYSNPENRRKARDSWHRLARIGAPNPCGALRTSGPSRGMSWSEKPAELAADLDIHFADDVVRSIGHEGWYTCPDPSLQTSDECFRGAVLKVRIPRSVAKRERIEADETGTYTRIRYVEAVVDTCNGDAAVARRYYDDMKAVARRADSTAEQMADSAREDWAKQEAEYRIGEKREEIASIRAEILEILVDRKTATGSPALCRAIRDRVSSMLAEIRKARKWIAKVEENFWKVVPNY